MYPEGQPNEPHYNCQVRFLRHIYLSSPTRNDNRADGTRAKERPTR